MIFDVQTLWRAAAHDAWVGVRELLPFALWTALVFGVGVLIGAFWR